MMDSNFSSVNSSEEEVQTGNNLNTLPMSIAYFILGCILAAVNVIIGSVLDNCEFTYATSLLMRFQCLANIIGLIPITFYSPLIKVFPWMLKTGSWVHRAFGCMVVFSLYMNFSLQTVMSINRFISIGFRSLALKVFSKRNTLLWLMAVFGHCTIWGIAVLFPCCQYTYQPASGGWGYTGYGIRIQSRAILGATVTLYLTCIIGHTGTLMKLRAYKKAIKNKLILAKEGKQELKVFFMFFVTAAVWFMLTGTFLFLIFFPQFRGPWVWFYLEIMRYVMHVVDPVMYFVTVEKVYKQVWKRIKCKYVCHCYCTEIDTNTGVSTAGGASTTASTHRNNRANRVGVQRHNLNGQLGSDHPNTSHPIDS